MRLSKVKLYKNTKINKGETLSTSELLERVGYIHQVKSGLFVQMHMMKRVINNIENLIRFELNKVSCLEIGLNQLQTADIWKQTGRYETYGQEMFRLKDRSDNEMVFTGTNEELVTLVAKNYVTSHKDLPFTFYQINNKFRDEIRCNTGLIRCKEFLMMDAYSFHKNKEELEKTYEDMKGCYISILDKLHLKYRIEKADSGEIGGSVSEEFIVETSDGDIEVGHIFQLDTKYSSTMKAQYVDNNNTKQDIVMGCYGIGISRLAQVLADVNRIENCFNWNNGIAPYEYVVVVADIKDENQMKTAQSTYEFLLNQNVSVYFDDRDVRVGEKLMEADIMGAANKILIGKNIQSGYFEYKKKSNDKWEQRPLVNQ